MLARSADGAMLVDHEGKVAYWNRTAERMLGFRAGEVLGRPCHDVLRAETPSGHALTVVLAEKPKPPYPAHPRPVM